MVIKAAELAARAGLQDAAAGRVCRRLRSRGACRAGCEVSGDPRVPVWRDCGARGPWRRQVSRGGHTGVFLPPGGLGNSRRLLAASLRLLWDLYRWDLAPYLPGRGHQAIGSCAPCSSSAVPSPATTPWKPRRRPVPRAGSAPLPHGIKARTDRQGVSFPRILHISSGTARAGAV